MASRHINLLRKYQKPILVVMGVILMVTFTVGYSLDTLINSGGFGGFGGGGGGQRDPVVVTWVGGKVRESELEMKRRTHQVAVNFLHKLIEQVVERGGQPIINGRPLPKDVPLNQIPFIDPGIGLDSSEQSIVQKLLLAKKADELGVVVDQQAAREFVESLSIPDVQPEEWRNILSQVTPQGLAMSVDQLLAQIAFDLKANHVLVLLQAGLADIAQGELTITPGQAWDYHNRLNRRFVIEAYPVDVAGFGAQVRAEPTEAELDALFEKGKSQDPNPLIPDPGFHSPHKIAFQWLRIDRGPFVEAAMKKITDEEVARRYELDKTQGLHKVLELPPDPTKPTDPAAPSDPAKPDAPANPNQSEPSTDKPSTDKPADKPADSASEKPVENKPAADKPAADKPADAKPEEKQPCDQQQGDAGQTELATKAQDEKKPSGAAPEKAEAEKQPEPEKPAVKPTDKPGETKVSEPPPVEAKPGEAPPTAAPAAGGTPAAAAPPVTPAPPPKFKPLEEVKEDIRKTLAQPIAEEEINAAVKKAIDEINNYGRKYSRWKDAQDAIKQGVKAGKAEDPGTLDVKAIAARHGFTSGSTELVDRHEIGNFEIGQKVMEFDMEAIRMGQFRQLSFADLAYRGSDAPFSPNPDPVDSTEPDVSFVYWRTAEQEATEPRFEDVRKQIVEAWKLAQAFDLAKADAQKLADKAQGAASLKDVVADPTKVITTIPFSWLTTGSLAFGSGSPSLSTVPGIDLAGVEFMEAVFSLQPSQTGVAPNQSHRTVYVVRIVSQQPTDDVLKEMFLESGLSRPVQMVAQSDLARTGREMLDGIEKEMDLVWERPPIEPEFR